MKPRRIYGRERLSALLAPKDTPQALRKATIENINADGTVDLRLADGVRYNVECSSLYTPQSGDSVRVLRADPFTLFVLGTTRTSNNTTVTVQNNVLIPYNVLKPIVDAPDPIIRTGTNYFDPVSTRSYRSLDGWSRSEIYQGAYSSGYGYWRGCYFYGTAPQSLRGKIVTGGSIRVHRMSTGGNSANVPQYIAPHAHYSRPSGAPYFVAGARLSGYVDWGQALELPLPASWLQHIVNGTASVRGFGHLVNATGSRYSINYSKGGDTHTGRLTIRWKSG